jgi:hypothetical protein
VAAPTHVDHADLRPLHPLLIRVSGSLLDRQAQFHARIGSGSVNSSTFDLNLST